MRRGLIGFIAVLQTISFLAHFFVYETWTLLSASGHRADTVWIKPGFAFLSVSFVSASLLAFRYTNAVVRAFYRVAAIWAGFLSFFFFASVLSWMVLIVARLTGPRLDVPCLVQWMFGLAALAAAYAVVNASWTRITRATVRLTGLPEVWRGRRIVLISDLHLGPVRNGSFLRRIVRKIVKEKPDAVFIAGDLFDGTAIDARRAAEPLGELVAPYGVYFAAGNHEQFGDDSKYLQAVAATGVVVLDNEKVDKDGLQIVGVPFRSAVNGGHFRAALQSVELDRSRASILMTHAPDHPEIAEAAGISLQLSGHTHRGQFLPWTWMARRVYRQFVYGLSRIGTMQVFTSSGAGSWGPPLRLGSRSEIVVLSLE
jgi:uncharacterized protein